SRARPRSRRRHPRTRGRGRSPGHARGAIEAGVPRSSGGRAVSDSPSEPESQMPDLGALLEQAQHMQEQLVQAQAAAAEQLVQGHAGGGVVTVDATGGMEFQKVTIDPKVVDPADVEMLEDLILAAI